MSVTGEMYYLGQTHMSGLNLSHFLPAQALRRINIGKLYQGVSSEIAA